VVRIWCHAFPGDKAATARRQELREDAILAGCTSVSVASSGGMAVCAGSAAGIVGIDVEEMVDHGELAEIARRFDEREQAWLLQVQPENWLESFYTLWTAKEAYVKVMHCTLDEALRWPVAFEHRGTVRVRPFTIASYMLCICWSPIG
jgi:hypothetical protein